MDLKAMMFKVLVGMAILWALCRYSAEHQMVILIILGIIITGATIYAGLVTYNAQKRRAAEEKAEREKQRAKEEAKRARKQRKKEREEIFK